MWGIRRRSRSIEPERSCDPRPAGAGGSRVSLSHGFRFVRLAADFASPVATSLDPSGVKKGTADSVTDPLALAGVATPRGLKPRVVSGNLAVSY